MAIYDVHNMEERLKQIDSLILRIDWCTNRKRHNIIAWDARNNEEYIAFSAAPGELDARVEREFYRIRNGNYNAFDELREWEAKKELNEEKRIADTAAGMADVLYKPLLQDAGY